MPADNQSANPPEFTVRVDLAEIEAADLAAKVDIPPAEFPPAAPPPGDDAEPPAPRVAAAPRTGPAPQPGGRAGIARSRGAGPGRRYAFRRS